MNLLVWTDEESVAKILGGVVACPTIEFPDRHKCRLDRLISGDDHYEIYPSDGTGKRMQVEMISCCYDGDGITFIFVETGYR